MRAYHEERGDDQRDEVITTIFSHPCNAASPATAGFKVITLMPDENGYPDLAALRVAVSERTAGLFITNPEDTGIYNPRIAEFVQTVHDVGGLAYYDQANANGLLGITRARDAGFDLCHFNVHKTFSAPHGSYGPGMGALGVRESLEKYLPVPLVEFDGEKYVLDYDRPDSVGKVRAFMGNAPIALKAYSWIMQHGAEGLKEAAQTSVLNNNYLEKLVREIPGVVVPYAEGKRRLEQVRYSWEKLYEDTGVGTDDMMRRASDYGIEHFWKSHHPWVVPEPFTLEPCESYSKDDLDEYAAILRQVSQEAYDDPEFVKNAPYNLPVHKVPEPMIENPDEIAVSWRQHLKRQEKHS
jgi:glycine dehydrogenase subunit 2